MEIQLQLKDQWQAKGECKKRAWLIYQKKEGAYIKAWASFPNSASSQGTTKILEANGDSVKDLLKRVQAEKGEVLEIPLSYLAFPTGFDLQVHLRYPGQADRETLLGGLESAFQGGYDSIVTMPNTEPFLDKPEILAKSREEVEKFIASLGWPMQVFFTAAGTLGMRGDKCANLQALVQAGAVAITDDGWGVREESAMAEIFSSLQEIGVPFLQHAEMPGHKGYASESEFQKKYNIAMYPRNAESNMVERDLAVLQKYPQARYHILHMSTRETLAALRKGKEAGLQVTGEVSPHHLFFANSDIPGEENPLSTAFKMNPPLFSPEDREALCDALARGEIDCVSTDHAPHTSEAKKGGWSQAPFGTRGLETALPVLVTLMKRGILSEARVREVYSFGGRKIIPAAAVPSPSGLVFVDPTKEFLVSEKDLPGISKNSCFLGQKLVGRIDFRAEPGQIWRR